MSAKNVLLSALVSGMLLSGCVTTGPTATDPNYDRGSKAGQKAVVVSQSARGAVITSDERILFETGKSEITSNGQVFIERVAKLLKEKTTANVQIDGHTDNQGGASFNQKLSEQRAASVKAGLVKNGVNANRIGTKGYGFSNPVADNGTPEGRQQNRRTEIVVLGESAEKIGGSTLADNLAEGLSQFLQNAGQFIKNVFGGTEDKSGK